MQIRTVAAVVLAFAGCSTTGLDRGKARRLIESYKSFDVPVGRVDCRTEALEAAAKEGILRVKKGRGSPFSFGEQYVPDRWEIMPAGEKYFAEVDDGTMSCTVKLAAPTKLRLVDVTGIADAPFGTGTHMKEVRYTWTLDLPEPVRRYTGTKGEGEGNAILRLYDDGWRVEELHVR